MAESQRLKFLDVARGICIICIILGHFEQDAIIRVVFTFHVPVFYLITGYFTTDKRDFGDYVKAKFRTLVVPYLITSLFIIVIRSIIGALSGDMLSELSKWSVICLVGNGCPVEFGSLWFDGVGPIWFLLASFIGSILLRALLSLSPIKRSVYVLAFFMIGYLSVGYVYVPFSIQAGLVSVLFMYLGYLYRSAQDSILSLGKEIKAAFVIFATAIWICFIKHFTMFMLVTVEIGKVPEDIIASIFASCVVIILSVFISEKLPRIAGFFSYFGKFSLLVLCIHAIEFKCIDQEEVLAKLQSTGMSFVAALMVNIVVKLALILGAAYAVSKIKAVRRIMGYRY